VSQQELLKQVVAALETAGAPYMITGSLASSLQGEPRSTHDIDLVVSLDPAAVRTLVAALPLPRYYLEEDAMRRAIVQRGMFNLIDSTEGGKVDFWLLTGEEFDVSRFGRRYPEDVMGMRLYVSAPEDTILVKLRWAKLSGGSEKQFTDALRVFEVQHAILDLNYLEEWAARLGVEPEWQRLKGEAVLP
jgi:hypothetical protein